MKNTAAMKTAAFLLAAAVFCLYPARALATADTSSASSNTSSTNSNTSSNTSSAVSSNSDDAVPEVTVSSNEQETLGTVGFADANTKRISVGKSTTLYLIIKDMGYDFSTTFETSDKSVATVEQIDTRAVKVVGIKSGTVTIYATVYSSKGEKKAKYELIVGDSEVSDSTQGDTASDDQQTDVGIITDYNDNDLDLFSSTTDPMLIEYAKARSNTNATSLLLGLIAWIFIISAVVYVFSVVIGLRTPKMNVSPGIRKRYSTGGSSPRAGNRLLSDRYYRNIKKY